MDAMQWMQHKWNTLSLVAKKVKPVDPVTQCTDGCTVCSSVHRGIVLYEYIVNAVTQSRVQQGLEVHFGLQ